MGSHSVLDVSTQGGTMSNAFAEHPSAYIICAGVVVAVVLYVIFDSNPGVSRSVGWALFTSPLSVTLLATLIGVVLNTELPQILAQNDVTLRTYSSDELGRGVAVVVAVVIWLVLIGRWFAHRRHRPRRIQKERLLNSEIQAERAARSRFPTAPRRDPTGRRLP